jgi:hypothetical protein
VAPLDVAQPSTLQRRLHAILDIGEQVVQQASPTVA